MAFHTYGTPLRKSPSWHLFRLSECLEDGGIRHCIAGDAVVATNNYPAAICDLYLVVADEQVDDALAILIQQGLEKTEGKPVYVDRKATIYPDGWPGHVLGRPDLEAAHINVVIVPASFWHMDLSEPSLSKNTFLHDGSRCRFPDRLYYLDVLIDLMVEGATKPGRNEWVYSWFHTQYIYMLLALEHETLRGLPIEDQWFIDLYERPLPPKIRAKVFVQRQRIRQGKLSVADAWKSIPRRALLDEEIDRRARGRPPQLLLTRGADEVIVDNVPDVKPLPRAKSKYKPYADAGQDEEAGGTQGEGGTEEGQKRTKQGEECEMAGGGM